MWVYDRETLRFVIVNDAAVRHYGYSKQEFLQMTIKDIHLKEDVRLLIEKLSDQFAQVENSDTWKHRKKDGTVIDVEITSHEIPFQDRTARLVLATDTTERKHLEEQLFLSQKMEAIGRLAGGIAHDFNNLLTAILGYGQLLLLDFDEGDPKRSHVEQIQKAGQSAASLTGQLLAFSRKQVLQPIVLDLNSVVANLGKMLQRMIGEDINLMIIAHLALGYVKADPAQIEQVIMNLAINARDAMPRGGKLTIETSNVDLDEAYAREHVSVNPGSFIMLAVSDTGSGMDKETQARIFEPFFTTKEIGKGTGLGLSTVYGIVKQSGGNIWVYSEPDRGTTFKIYLPRVYEEPGPSRPEADQTGSRGSETILLIEDDQDVRRLARIILQMNGYTVLEAERESEALLICEQQDKPIHLMISDVVMPKLSGPVLAEQLSRLRPEMKVLFMSGYTDESIVHHGILDPGTAFLQKPFTPEALTSKVRQVLNQP
jgi:PAS domain S-box-containing protein